VSYTFGNIVPAAASGRVTVALPYGSWRLQTSTTASGSKTALPAGRLAALTPAMPERTTIATSGVVTFDPRTAVLP